MRSTMHASGSGTGTHLQGTRSFAQALAPLREKERAAGPQLSEPIQLNIPQQPRPPSQPAVAEPEIEDEDVQIEASDDICMIIFVTPAVCFFVRQSYYVG